MAIGALFWGKISDQYGRKIPFTATLPISALFGMGAVFSVNFPMLVAMVFMMGFGIGGNLPVVIITYPLSY